MSRFICSPSLFASLLAQARLRDLEAPAAVHCEDRVERCHGVCQWPGVSDLSCLSPQFCFLPSWSEPLSLAAVLPPSFSRPGGRVLQVQLISAPRWHHMKAGGVAGGKVAGESNGVGSLFSRCGPGAAVCLLAALMRVPVLPSGVGLLFCWPLQTVTSPVFLREQLASTVETLKERKNVRKIMASLNEALPAVYQVRRYDYGTAYRLPQRGPSRGVPDASGDIFLGCRGPCFLAFKMVSRCRMMTVHAI